jgi:hypothetical protein
MWRRVPSNLEPGFSEHARDKGYHGPFSVGACHVDGQIFQLRIVNGIEQVSDIR